MTPEQIDTLQSLKTGLQHLVEVAKGAPQPTRAILSTQIFLLVAKVKFLLGEE